MEHPDHTQASTSEFTAPMDVPAGFTIVDGPNSEKYLVPTYLVHATELALKVNSKRQELKADEAQPGVSFQVFDVT